tara:strand:- start:2928 stop:3989 length:1062 start_codon:yes stop_codon:yes gene_type:complete
MNIFIPEEKEVILDKHALFVILRPFFVDGKFKNNNNYYNWDLKDVNIVTDLKISNLLCIPMPINYYHENKMFYLLNKYNQNCQKFNINGYGVISGDFCRYYPEFDKIIYFRMGGFKSTLSNNNQGFPATLSDQVEKIFGRKKIIIHKKSVIPKIGFCGHATASKTIYIKQTIKFMLENIKRFFSYPLRKDYEIFFQSGFIRYQILKKIEKDSRFQTDFIYRNQYRAGAKNLMERKTTTLDHYNNIIKSDYTICIRGTGNFSIRFYETLMMGRIPILIDTDCILPFHKIINWDKHIIRIKWSEIDNFADIVLDFHKNISQLDFIKMQKNNRKLWLEKLNPSWTLKHLFDLRNEN